MNNNCSRKHLEHNLAQIRRVFPKVVQNAEKGIIYSDTKIRDYYEGSILGYRLFHSRDGAVHMAISNDGSFKRSDYMSQVDGISEIIEKLPGDSHRILEIGCGQGFNIYHLACRFPNHMFTGIDIAPSHLKYARKLCRGKKNTSFINSDASSMTDSIRDIDLAFAVEAICHVQDLHRMVKSLLATGSENLQIVVYDGFREDNNPKDEALALAGRLVEYSMAVPKFHTADAFKRVFTEAGFEIINCVDLSENIMPNLLRLNSMAQSYYNRPIMSRMLKHILGSYLTQNSIAGLLLPVVITEGVFTYRKICFSRI